MSYPTEKLQAGQTGPARSDGDAKAGSRRLSSVLVVDDEPGILRSLQKGMAARFSLVETAPDADSADALLSRCHFDLIISDIRLPGRSGVEWVSQLRDPDRRTLSRNASVRVFASTRGSERPADDSEPDGKGRPLCRSGARSRQKKFSPFRTQSEWGASHSALALTPPARPVAFQSMVLGRLHFWVGAP